LAASFIECRCDVFFLFVAIHGFGVAVSITGTSFRIST
jgi:hypothetical protein